MIAPTPARKEAAALPAHLDPRQQTPLNEGLIPESPGAGGAPPTMTHTPATCSSRPKWRNPAKFGIQRVAVHQARVAVQQHRRAGEKRQPGNSVSANGSTKLATGTRTRSGGGRGQARAGRRRAAVDPAVDRHAQTRTNTHTPRVRRALAPRRSSRWVNMVLRWDGVDDSTPLLERGCARPRTCVAKYAPTPPVLRAACSPSARGKYDGSSYHGRVRLGVAGCPRAWSD
jgi:hypothetical protein